MRQRWVFMGRASVIKGLFKPHNLLLGLLLGAGFSCVLNKDEIATDPSLTLRFSADTVFFDTIFSEIPSISKRLRVYNDHSQAVSIASIALASANSPYYLTVNGARGQRFANTRILANDSILLIIEANLSPRDSTSPYVVEDQLRFVTNGNQQEVAVFSWGQDANYLKDSVLTCNAVWQAGKPYVIYNSILIDSLCTLTVGPGVRIFSHPGATIYIKGALRIEGSAEDRVLLMNDRFDGNYPHYPGQWGGLVFLEGSKNNRIKFADIRNARVGIWLGTPDDDNEPDLVLENTIIENMSEVALLAFTSDLTMTNCLLHNSGQFVFAGLAGGNYRLQHNTLANYSFGFFKTQPVVAVTDRLELADGSVLQAPVNLELKNNIVWGISNDELILLNEAREPFTLEMLNNLLKTTEAGYEDFGNIINQDPLFIGPEEGNYQPDSLSPAIDAGADLGILFDLRQQPRQPPADIGAYERQQ